jgi:DNA repair protein RadC
MKKSSINKWPVTERPREKLLMSGPDRLTNSELLAILIQTGHKYKDDSFSAVDIAKEILVKFKDLKSLMNTLPCELLSFKGIGKAKASKLAAAFELGRRCSSEKNLTGNSFKCSEEVAAYYIPLLKDLKKEQFRIILLDAKNRIIREELISQGSLTSSLARPVKLIFIQKEKRMIYLN